MNQTPNEDRTHLPVSVVVLTYNEAQHLPRCLESLRPYFDDVHVLDSDSIDGTGEVARQCGASVHVNAPFEGFGRQRNWAIDNIPHRYQWALHLDADETVDEAFCDELRQIVDDNTTHCGYHVPNRLILDGKWLRYAGGYPTYQVRLFRLGELRFENYGHGQREVTQGTLGRMRSPYNHDAFCKGLDHWFGKHAGYARAEADKARAEFAEGKHGLLGLCRDLFGDSITRRRSLKRMVHRLPFRASLRMFHILVWKRGVLDGRAGWTFARMMAAYETMIAVHLGRPENESD
ncbi:MAG: glycosyltransferase family 2 protein [Planctomycetota bacterium]